MYLKEIKLSGFKSFADKTSISLDNDITCIVGPNGSGKSNIVDAVRWVLGEQSIKSLRGNNGMTDVIFSGSKTRQSLNLASVSLIFDNSDGYLPVPYTEIAVTRKVFKTGENEYYLNNEKCRLKDIGDLFLDSGMGKSAFNIISQGEIERIISNSPEERRVIFEEVAGVTKYKKRKDEALKKLDKTNDNLERVKDIINELELQIEPLKEQSEQAKIYLENKEKLKNIEISLLTHDIEYLNNSYNINKSEKEHLENELIKLSTKNTSDDLELSKNKERLGELEAKLVDLNNKLLNLTKEEEQVKAEKSIIQERNKYDAEDQKIYMNISNLKEEKLKLESELDSIKKELIILNSENEKIVANRNKVLNDYNILDNDRNTKYQNINNHKNKLIEIDYKIKNLKNYLEEGGGVNNNVKRILNNPKLTGIHGTIIKLINVEEEYILALDVALGGAKDYVVVDTPIIAKNCIKFLKDNNLGRVTFFPLDVIKPRYVDEETKDLLISMDGFIDILSNLVTHESIYDNIIKNQLGNVILVDNIDNANAIAKSINNRYKIVTLTGEVINVGGAITGGNLRKDNNYISSKYELEKLKLQELNYQKELEELNKSVEHIVKQCEEKKEELHALELDIVKQKELINYKETIKNDVKDKHHSTIKELESLSDLQSNNLANEEDRLLKQYYEIINTKNDVIKQIELINKNKETISAAIENLEIGYRYNNSQIRDLETKLKEIEVTISKNDIKIDNLLNQLNENYSITFEKAKSEYVLEIDEKEARKEVNYYKNIIKHIGMVNIGAIEEYERVSTRYEFLTKQKEDLTKAINMLLEIIDELDKVMKQEFTKSFKEVEVEFSKVFKDLFKGGNASLKLLSDDVLTSGVDIIVSPPGKKLSTISLLSGGEKSLTAISLLFAILNVRKLPFCLFDEVEAALDEANVEAFGKYLSKYKDVTQFLIITHKKKTMEYADNLYGITMQESGVSKLVSVKLVD